MATLRFIGFCMMAVPVTITALSFIIVAWTTTPAPSVRTRLIATGGGLGTMVASLAVGLRLFSRVRHRRRDHG